MSASNSITTIYLSIKGNKSQNFLKTDFLIQKTPRGVHLILTLVLLLTADSSSLIAQSQIIRGTFGSAGGTTSSGESRMHGTLSQSAIGQTQGKIFHEAGFWRYALLPNVEVVVSLPEVKASIGHKLTIPLELTSVSGSLAGETRPFTARIRYNATLLEPIGSTAPCFRVGDTCYMELSGTAPFTPGTLVGLEFRAKLGNDTGTSLTIEEFKWERLGEATSRVITVDGQFTLLGVCREGDSLRLIHSGPSVARLALAPNPARERTVATIGAAESGATELILFDMMGKEIALLSRFDAAAERLYRVDLDLNGIPSGAYTLLCRTPSETITERLMITQ